MKNLLILFLVFGFLIWVSPIILMVILLGISTIDSVLDIGSDVSFVLVIGIFIVGVVLLLLKPLKK